MDVVSDKNIDLLVATRRRTRVYAQEDGTWLAASGGTVARHAEAASQNQQQASMRT